MHGMRRGCRECKQPAIKIRSWRLPLTCGSTVPPKLHPTVSYWRNGMHRIANAVSQRNDCAIDDLKVAASFLPYSPWPYSPSDPRRATGLPSRPPPGSVILLQAQLGNTNFSMPDAGTIRVLVLAPECDRFLQLLPPRLILDGLPLDIFTLVSDRTGG